jgi:hypothetical protein
VATVAVTALIVASARIAESAKSVDCCS